MNDPRSHLCTPGAPGPAVAVGPAGWEAGMPRTLQRVCSCTTRGEPPPHPKSPHAFPFLLLLTLAGGWRWREAYLASRMGGRPELLPVTPRTRSPAWHSMRCPKDVTTASHSSDLTAPDLLVPCFLQGPRFLLSHCGKWDLGACFVSGAQWREGMDDGKDHTAGTCQLGGEGPFKDKGPAQRPMGPLRGLSPVSPSSPSPPKPTTLVFGAYF